MGGSLRIGSKLLGCEACNGRMMSEWVMCARAAVPRLLEAIGALLPPNNRFLPGVIENEDRNVGTAARG